MSASWSAGYTPSERSYTPASIPLRTIPAYASSNSVVTLWPLLLGRERDTELALEAGCANLRVRDCERCLDARGLGVAQIIDVISGDAAPLSRPRRAGRGVFRGEVVVVRRRESRVEAEEVGDVPDDVGDFDEATAGAAGADCEDPDACWASSTGGEGGSGLRRL